MTGVKHDRDKPSRPELMSPTALIGLSKVLKAGAEKYADRNWEKGMAWSRVYGALMRHMLAFWEGEDIDPETGLPHLDHAQCCIHFLSHYYHGRYDDFDDRPVNGIPYEHSASTPALSGDPTDLDDTSPHTRIY